MLRLLQTFSVRLLTQGRRRVCLVSITLAAFPSVLLLPHLALRLILKIRCWKSGKSKFFLCRRPCKRILRWFEAANIWARFGECSSSLHPWGQGSMDMTWPLACKDGLKLPPSCLCPVGVKGDGDRNDPAWGQYCQKRITKLGPGHFLTCSLIWDAEGQSWVLNHPGVYSKWWSQLILHGHLHTRHQVLLPPF